MTRKHAWGTALYYLVTLLIAFIAMVPFVWMISTSLKTRGALMSIPIEWVPEHPTLDAYQTVFERFPFFQTILNSLFISVSYTVLTLLSASLAAYAFTKIRFRGSGLVLGLYLATMMIPTQVTMIPLFVVMNQLGLINHYASMILPSVFKPFAVFMLVQQMRTIPGDYLDAAKIDGANGWKTFWRITVPLLKPTIIMTFIMSINGTLQLFDESVNLTKGGPANTTITMSHYVYNTCFINVPNFGYAAAMSFLIFIMVAILAFINLKVGDTRD